MAARRALSPDFVSRQEAAERLMLSQRQIDRLTRAGILPKIRTSANRCGIPRVAFDAYLASRTTNATIELVPIDSDGGLPSFFDLTLETTLGRDDVVALVGNLGFRGVFSAAIDRPGGLRLLWHKGMGFVPSQVRAALLKLGIG